MKAPIQVSKTAIKTGFGGTGGPGGPGALGGQGGMGGKGGPKGDDDTQGLGADGGAGGKGGNGGPGGGGGGGPSIGVACGGGASVALDAVSFVLGQAGEGGASQGGLAGKPGVRAETYGCGQ